MPRTYSESFLRKLNDNENIDSNLGIELAKLCVSARIPMAYVAKVFDVSKLSVFHWFRGAKIKESRHRTAFQFMAVLDRDLKSGVLPAKTHLEAKSYIQAYLGKEI